MADLGAVSQSPADGGASWLEHETAEARLDPTGQGRVVAAMDMAETKTEFLLLDPHVQSHTEYSLRGQGSS